MINAQLLGERFAEFLGSETEVANGGQRITLLTPAEYPDCDALSVTVELAADGAYIVSDLAAADSMLVGYLNPRSAASKAEAIVERFNVRFERGTVLTRVSEDELPEACWRVAQASAAIAEAVSFVAPLATPKPEFDAVVADALARRQIEFRRNYTLRGLSGHEHTTSIFVPTSEAVIEPIAGRKAWDRATKVYAEFGDLRQVNGYRLLAVLDDRERDLSQVAKLLSQVALVATWSRSDVWLDRIARPGGEGELVY